MLHARILRRRRGSTRTCCRPAGTLARSSSRRRSPGSRSLRRTSSSRARPRSCARSRARGRSRGSRGGRILRIDTELAGVVDEVFIQVVEDLEGVAGAFDEGCGRCPEVGAGVYYSRCLVHWLALFAFAVEEERGSVEWERTNQQS